MKYNLKSKAGRAKLTPRREPYWSRIETGLYIGYRVVAEGTGTWIARKQIDSKKVYQALGIQPDYDTAVKAARQWSEHQQHIVDDGVKVETVSQACSYYLANHLIHKNARSAADAKTRFKRLIDGHPIGRCKLENLTAPMLRKWVNEQITEPEGPALDSQKRSVNRNLNRLKAALNFVKVDRGNLSDIAWKSVKRFTVKPGQRQLTLTRQQRNHLIESCPEHLGYFVKALVLTGARPGEMAAAAVKDFDPKKGTLTLRGKTGHRTIQVSSAAKDFFCEISKGKLPKAPLIADKFGNHWDKDSWKKPFRRAVKKANLPSGIVAYTLRHTFITDAVVQGVDVFTVAKLCGTSIAMIDSHYGHLAHSRALEALDRVAML